MPQDSRDDKDKDKDKDNDNNNINNIVKQLPTITSLLGVCFSSLKIVKPTLNTSHVYVT